MASSLLFRQQLSRQSISSSPLSILEKTFWSRVPISKANNNNNIRNCLPLSNSQWIHTSTIKYQPNTDNISTSTSPLSSLPSPREIYNYDENIQQMTNEQLSDPFTIPGFVTLIHSPPRDRATTPRNALVGKVVSDKMQKTVNVQVDRYKIIPKYKKRMKYSKKFMAHDEEEVCQEGDLVMIVPCQRLSRRKHFRVHEIIKKGHLLKSMESS